MPIVLYIAQVFTLLLVVFYWRELQKLQDNFKISKEGTDAKLGDQDFTIRKFIAATEEKLKRETMNHVARVFNLERELKMHEQFEQRIESMEMDIERAFKSIQLINGHGQILAKAMMAKSIKGEDRGKNW